MHRIDIDSIGGPTHERFHRTRAGASVVAAVAGGVAIFGLMIAALVGIAPAESPFLWAGIGVFVAVWLTGLYWRWDAPDARELHDERERRGF